MFTDFDLDLDVVRRRRGVKWTKYGPDVIPAWVADMDFTLAPCIAAALHEAIDLGDIGYPPDTGSVVAAFCHRACAQWSWTVDPSLVFVMPDVVKSIEFIINAHTEPGDAIVVNTPIYPPFLKTPKGLNRRTVDNPLAADGSLDLDHLQHVVDSEHPKVLLLCNPHNPTGRVLRRDELHQACRIAKDCIIISDEIHGELVYLDSPAHTPTATLDADIAERTFTLTSASKPFNLAGLRVALIVSGTPDLHASIERQAAANKAPIGTLGLYATQAAWTPEGDAWLAACLEILNSNRHALADWSLEHGVGFRLPEATYLGWLDMRSLGLDDEPHDWFLRHAGVGLSVGTDFGLLGAGHTRLNFATSPGILASVLDRMANSLHAGSNRA